MGLPIILTLGIAAVLSLVWGEFVRGYVRDGPGWANVLDSHPTDFALFLASVTAPLAALWLVAGFIVFGLALWRAQEAVRATQRQAVRTSGEIEALIRTSIEMQEQARRQSFLNGADLALKDLNSQAGMITGRLGVLSPDETEYLWALNAAGDPWAFCHALLERSELQEDFLDLVADRVAGDEVASAALQRFLRRYERLLALAKEYDADKLMREVLEDGPLDRLYALFQAVSNRVQAMVGPPVRPDLGPDTPGPGGPFLDERWDPDPGMAPGPPPSSAFPADGPGDVRARRITGAPYHRDDEAATVPPGGRRGRFRTPWRLADLLASTGGIARAIVATRLGPRGHRPRAWDIAPPMAAVPEEPRDSPV